MSHDSHNKLEKLKALLTSCGRVAICFSGGVDSTFLAKVAVDQLGYDNVLGILADTPSMPRAELESARKMAKLINLNLVEVMTCEIDDPHYISNPVDRCYFCKEIIFGSLIAEARERGFERILDGNNADDAGEYRPGHKAAVELGVATPLMDAGLTKSDIRALSREIGLPTADKPALACLATRVTTGTPITRDLLARIEKAEQVAWDAGFSQVRVRDHGERACLEIAEPDFTLLSDKTLREQLVQEICAAGYENVVLNLAPLCRR